MPDASLIIPFLFACFLIEATPGPNMGYLAVIGAGSGRRAGMMAVAGVTTGLAAVGLAAVLGFSMLMAQWPVLYDIVRLGGVLFMLWLAAEAWRGTRGADDGTDDGRFFRRGFLTNILNPKAYIFYITILPRFGGDTLSSALLLTVLYVGVATLVHGSIVLMASRAHIFLGDPQRARIWQRGFALMLLAVAFWFAWDTARG